MEYSELQYDGSYLLSCIERYTGSRYVYCIGVREMKKDSKRVSTVYEQTAAVRQEYKAAAQEAASLIEIARELKSRARQAREQARELRRRADRDGFRSSSRVASPKP